MEFRIFAAPLQGLTEAPFCEAHASVYGTGGMADCYFTPFMRVERGEVRPRDVGNMRRSLTGVAEVVPQAIFRDGHEVSMIADAVRGAGGNRIDLNLGCPFPPQVHHGRGAAWLGKSDELADAVSGLNGMEVSVKMRLGIENPDEWRALLPVLNDLPLAHVTIHPRVARQQYKGELYMEEFGKLLGEARHPVIYNGDIAVPEDIDRLHHAYPALTGVMVGRGLMARPSLFAEWREGREWSRTERLDSVKALHNAILEDYTERLCGDAQVLAKIKPFWEYMEPEIGHRAFKAIHKARNLAAYRSVVMQIE